MNDLIERLREEADSRASWGRLATCDLDLIRAGGTFTDYYGCFHAACIAADLYDAADALERLAGIPDLEKAALAEYERGGRECQRFYALGQFDAYHMVTLLAVSR